MKFCPKCQARLKLDSSDSEFVCPKCGYSEKGSKATKQVKNETVSSITNN
jgi:transcription factor S